MAGDTVTQPAPQPWSKNRLMREMRKVGYYRPDRDFAIYRHKETGKEIDLDKFENGSTVWRVWAAARMTPPPF